MVRWSLALALPVVAGCVAAPVHVQDCYQDEACSSEVPFGLQFVGVDATESDGHPDWPGPIAIGGRATITLLRYLDNLHEHTEPLTLPFTADDSGHAGVEVVGVDGNRVTVHALADASNLLRILAPDGRLYDRWPLVGLPIDRVQVRPATIPVWGPTRDEDVVFLPGDHDLVVALWAPTTDIGSSPNLYDESLQLAMPDATPTAWNTLHATGLTVGHRTLAITGGSGARTIDVETVAAPDEIVTTDTQYISFDVANLICFHARHHGRAVADAQWSFEVTGAQLTTDAGLQTPRSGCAYYWPDARTGTFTVHAHASGYTQAIEIPIAG